MLAFDDPEGKGMNKTPEFEPIERDQDKKESKLYFNADIKKKNLFIVEQV